MRAPASRPAVTQVPSTPVPSTQVPSTPTSKIFGPLKELWREIDTFWFGYGSPVSLGVFRILLGLVNLLNLIFLIFDFDAWFSERGFVPTASNFVQPGLTERNFNLFGHTYFLPFSIPRLSVLELDFTREHTYQIVDPRVSLLLFIVLIVAALFTMLGLWTRASSIILAVGVVTLQHRNMLILHGGDSVMRLGALYMAIAPSGAACSLDRVIGLWRGKAPLKHRLVSLWPQRVIQFNLALIYFTTWWGKMDGMRWRNGTAVWFPAQLNEFKRFWLPEIVHHPGLVPILTYGTLGVELALGTIVFWKPARNTVLILGLLLHGVIEYSMNIPLFALAICSYYVTFYSGEEVSQAAKWFGERLKRWRITVTTPPLKQQPALALEAMDPLKLVKYEVSEVGAETVEIISVVDANGKPRKLTAVALRSVGAFPWGLAPGVWKKLMLSAELR